MVIYKNTYPEKSACAIVVRIRKCGPMLVHIEFRRLRLSL